MVVCAKSQFSLSLKLSFHVSLYLAHNPGHVDIMINTTYLVLMVSYFALIALIFGLASWGTFVAILIQSGTYCPILLAAIFRQTTDDGPADNNLRWPLC